MANEKKVSLFGTWGNEGILTHLRFSTEYPWKSEQSTFPKSEFDTIIKDFNDAFDAYPRKGMGTKGTAIDELCQWGCILTCCLLCPCCLAWSVWHSRKLNEDEDFLKIMIQERIDDLNKTYSDRVKFSFKPDTSINELITKGHMIITLSDDSELEKQ